MKEAAYRFADFELLPARRQLRRSAEDVAVTPRAFDLLVTLVLHAGQVVSKSELIGQVWPRLAVEENNLHAQVSVLRKLLGPHAIATVPGRGYAFTLPVSAEGTSAPRAAEEQRQNSGKRAELRVRGNNLPAELPPLYGRDGALDALSRLVAQRRIVSVVGPAGIGKTRLVQALAHRRRDAYADGVWFVELAPVDDPTLVVSTIAGALDCAVASGEDALPSLVLALKDQSSLLVLDNCEHLLTPAADVVTRLHAAAPGVRMVVTSREPLHVGEEHVYRLPPLAVPADSPSVDDALDYGAVELFVARSLAADPAFALRPDNTAAVIDICRRLDGIPLAIELAAARVPLLGLAAVRERLGEQLGLLRGGLRTASPRHQTLRAALQWSYALLTADERSMFDRLGVFVGSFSMQAAQLLSADAPNEEWPVLDHLAALVDKSLVSAEQGERARYRLLESSRAFALERLSAAGSLERMRARHAKVIATTLAGGDSMEGPTERARRVAPDLDNARAAAAWATGPTGDREIAIGLAGGTDMLWDVQGCSDEGNRFYRIVEPWVHDTTPPRNAAHYWFAVANVRLWTESKRQADAGLRAAALFRTLGDRYWLFRTLVSLTSRLSQAGDAPTAAAAIAEAQELYDSSWPPWCRMAMEHALLAYDHLAIGEFERVRARANTIATLYRQFGGDSYYADTAELLAIGADQALGHFESAERRARALLSVPSFWISGRKGRGQLLNMLGLTLTSLGRLDEAEDVLREALPLIRQGSGSAGWTLRNASYLLARRNRLGDAARVAAYCESDPTARWPSGRRVLADTSRLVDAGLPSEQREQLRIEGRRLTEDHAVGIAFPTRA